MKFTMLIKEIFNFQDGRIVFVGKTDSDVKLIKTCICSIFIDKNLFSIINIEGEMISNGNNSGLRLVSTFDRVDIKKIPYHVVNVWMKCNN